MNSKLHTSSTSERGFTLIELLVVIAIIAVLTAIAVPAFLSQRQKANEASLRSDMKSMAQSLETWYVDNPNGVIPPDRSRGSWSMIVTGESGKFVGGAHSPTIVFPPGFDVPAVNKGTAIGVIARGSAHNEGGPGNFCILGNMRDSKFIVPDDFLISAENGTTYQFSMFYDSQVGGLHTAETLPPGGSCQDYYAQIHAYDV